MKLFNKMKIILVGLMLFSLSGCATVEEINPFGTASENKPEPESSGPLVMPGELDNQSSQNETIDQEGNTENGSKSSGDSLNNDVDGTKKEIDFTSKADTNRAEKTDENPNSKEESGGIIKPEITDREKAEELAEKARKAYDEDRFKKAVELYRQATRLSPSSIKYLANLGSLYFNRGEYEQSLEAYQKALSLDSDRPNINFYAGIAHYRLENYEKARSYLEKTLELNPDNQRAKTFLKRITN